MTLRGGKIKQKLTLYRCKMNTEKAIPCEFQHVLVVGDVDKKKIKKSVGKTCIEMRKIRLLKDVKMRKRFEDKVNKLVDVRVPYLWGHFKDRVSKAMRKKAELAFAELKIAQL